VPPNFITKTGITPPPFNPGGVYAQRGGTASLPPVKIIPKPGKKRHGACGTDLAAPDQ
tara:strand:+ start:1522 stop:1695 length:174 start_codon:yes stop_codon:yes gene_type:complete